MKLLAISLAALALLTTGCTQNGRARAWGGTTSVNLPAGKKLVTITWHGNDLWYLTRPMTTDDKAETYELIEDSSMGVFNGKVIVHEVK